MIRINPTVFCFFQYKRHFFLRIKSFGWSSLITSLLDAIATNGEFRNRCIKLSMIDGFWKEPKKQRRRRRRRFVKLFVQREKRRADKRFKNKLKRCLLCMMCVCALACVQVCICASLLQHRRRSRWCVFCYFIRRFFLRRVCKYKKK